MKITEEMNIQKEWYRQAPKQKIKTLMKFITHLLDDYEHDYGTIVHAIASIGIAAMYAANEHPQGGITGFQSGAIMWEIILKWGHFDYPLRLQDFNEMLYPQYEDKFQKTISQASFKNLQDKAIKLLKDKSNAHPNVIEHWKTIANGLVPFGYRIEERNKP